MQQTLRVFDAVLFDMDGTLIDSTPSVHRSWARWAEEYGVPLEVVESSRGGRTAAALVALLVAPELATEATARINAYELTDTEDIVTLPGAAELVRAIPLGRAAVVTSSGAELAKARLGAAGFPAPDTVVTADDVVHGKPDPEPYLTAAHRLGVDITRCLVVEDSLGGLAAGHAAGATTLGVLTGLDGAELAPDLLVEDLTHVHATAAPGGVAVTIG